MKKTVRIVLSALLAGCLLLACAPAALAAPAQAGFDFDAFQDKLLNNAVFMRLYLAYTANTTGNFAVLSRLRASGHLEHNQALESELYENDEILYIMDQRFGPASEMLYGTRDLAYNGCELIAVHNAMLALEKPKKISSIVYDFERCGALWLEGEFGTKISQYKRYLNKQGFSTEEFRTPGGMDQARKDGDVFIITFQNPYHLSIHTIMVLQVDGMLETYNHYGGLNDSFESLMDYSGTFLKGYRVSI